MSSAILFANRGYREGGDPFSSPQEPHTFIGFGLNVNLLPRDVQCVRKIQFHIMYVVHQSWPFQDDGRIYIVHDKTLISCLYTNQMQQFQAGYTFISRVCIGKISADVSISNGADYGVAYG